MPTKHTTTTILAATIASLTLDSILHAGSGAERDLQDFLASVPGQPGRGRQQLEPQPFGFGLGQVPVQRDQP